MGSDAWSCFTVVSKWFTRGGGKESAALAGLLKPGCRQRLSLSSRMWCHWGFLSLLTPSDPINQYVQRRTQLKRVRARVASSPPSLLYWVHLHSFKCLFSSLLRAGSTHGNEFSYEVKYEISRTELLMHFSIAHKMDFLRKKVGMKVPPVARLVSFAIFAFRFMRICWIIDVTLLSYFLKSILM